MMLGYEKDFYMHFNNGNYFCQYKKYSKNRGSVCIRVDE